MVVDGGSATRRVRYMLAGGFGVLGALALAGPSWNAVEVPITRLQTARIVALDLSLSMDARDILPSRLEVAREKARKILAQTGEQQAGLIVFAGDGFEIAPLTTDAQSLIGLLPAFETSVMPLQGSRPDLALEHAQALLRRGAPSGGEIVLITDGAKGRRVVDVAARLLASGIRVSVLAVGTAEGGRIPLSGGANLRGLDGKWVVAETPLDLLADVAHAGGGNFATATADDSDLAKLLLDEPVSVSSADFASTGRHARMWLDRGPWLVLPLLAVLALGFRRGWIFSLAFISLCLPMASLEASQPDGAPPARSASSSETSTGADRPGTVATMDLRWRAVELYRAGRYQDAATLFGNGDGADDHYNRGNALALAGHLRSAVAAYREALARDDEHADAHYNLAVVRSLLEESEEGEQRDRWTGEDFDPSGDGTGAAGDGMLGEQVVRDVETPSDPAERDPIERAQDEEPQRNPVEQNRRQRNTSADRATPIPSKPTRELTPEEIEGMEETLRRISEQRLTLWRRKLMRAWHIRRRKPLPMSSAW